MVGEAGARVLIVDDDPASRRLLEVRLRPLGCSVATACDGEQALALAREERPTLILLDLEMPRMGGMQLLQALQREGLEIPAVVVTAYGSIERAVEAMKQGAYDFIPKPFDPKHLQIVVQKILERERLRRGLEILGAEADERHRLVLGPSAAMAALIETAKKAAASSATVLVMGESGTGKELLARAVHNWSGRRAGPFVTINCVGLSRELLESELFGHEKGAFTGAHELKRGRMELADGGSVFLDEVGDISAELQAKLLRFLQEREFERVGGTRTIRIDARIIAATNRDLEALVREGRFREDLYHRLNVVPILLPPLRERKEDIPVLVDHFCKRFSRETKKVFTAATEEALKYLMGYAWPGNVRELANAVERAVVLGSGPKIDVQDLPARVLGGISPPAAAEVSYRDALQAAKRQAVTSALARSQGNRAAAAKSLGLHEKYLLRLIKALGLD